MRRLSVLTLPAVCAALLRRRHMSGRAVHVVAVGGEGGSSQQRAPLIAEAGRPRRAFDCTTQLPTMHKRKLIATTLSSAEFNDHVVLVIVVV